MKGRTLFLGGNFNGIPGQGVKPITLAVYSYDIPQNELPTVLKRALPAGWTGTSPQVVKTLDGEFLVYASGTIEFVPLGRSAQQVWPPIGLAGARSRKRMGGVQYGEVSCPNEANVGACWRPGVTMETGAGVEETGLTSCYGDFGYPGQCGAVWNGYSKNQPGGIPQCVQTPDGAWTHPNCVAAPPEEPPPEEPPEIPPTDECPPGQRDLAMISGLRCVYGGVACPDGEGTYTVFETDASGNIIGLLGYKVDKASLDVDGIPVDDTLDRPECVTPEIPPTEEIPPPPIEPTAEIPPPPIEPTAEIPPPPIGPLPGIPAPTAPIPTAPPGLPTPAAAPTLGPVPMAPPSGPFPQTFYPCGGTPYGVPDLATQTSEFSSLSQFDQTKTKWVR